MKRHLTEQELIEYRFKLAADAEAERAGEHLAECRHCRAELEKLERKFASLDLLRGEVAASEDLISRVIEQAGRPRRIKVAASRKLPAWAAAAAAVLVVGVLIMVANHPGQRKGDEPSAKGPEKGIAVPPTELRSATGDKSGLGGMAAMAEGIPDKPPFAPASAIELVVLPRRENVQLTIYNSTFQTLRMSGGYGDLGGGRGGYGGRMGGSGGGGGGYGGGGYGGLGVKLDEATSKALEEAMKRAPSMQMPISAPGGDVTLVRERRNLTLKRGWNWLQFMWANTLIDPTSLSLEPLEKGDKIDIQQLVFPARLRELGRWLIRSEVSGQVPFEITYFTSGLSWRAFYMGTLAPDEKTMRMKGYVRVANASGEDYENAQTRLIVGNVHILDKIAELAKRRYPYGSPIPEGGGYGGGGYGGMIKDVSYALPPNVQLDSLYLNGAVTLESLGALRPKEIKKEGLSEYFLYTIEGTETIPDKWGKRLLSFEAEDIEVESLYKYDEERWGNQTIRFVKFANDEEHNLGETPIPDGQVKIFGQADEDGSLSYVGGTSVKYIPVNEEVELDLGAARLVKVEPKLMGFRTDNYRFDPQRNISGWDEIRTWNVEIANTRGLAVEIEITRGFGTPYWTLKLNSENLDYEKHDATHARVELKLDPQTKRTVEYTVTTYHGARIEDRAQNTQRQ